MRRQMTRSLSNWRAAGVAALLAAAALFGACGTTEQSESPGDDAAGEERASSSTDDAAEERASSSTDDAAEERASSSRAPVAPPCTGNLVDLSSEVIDIHDPAIAKQGDTYYIYSSSPWRQRTARRTCASGPRPVGL